MKARPRPGQWLHGRRRKQLHHPADYSALASANRPRYPKDEGQPRSGVTELTGSNATAWAIEFDGPRRVPRGAKGKGARGSGRVPDLRGPGPKPLRTVSAAPVPVKIEIELNLRAGKQRFRQVWARSPMPRAAGPRARERDGRRRPARAISLEKAAVTTYASEPDLPKPGAKEGSSSTAR